jgi:hypothetical protein
MLPIVFPLEHRNLLAEHFHSSQQNYQRQKNTLPEGSDSAFLFKIILY